MSLPNLTTRRLRIKFLALEDALLSEFKGSMLRGSLAHAMARTTCKKTNSKQCDACEEATDCPFYIAFKKRFEDEVPWRKPGNNAPRPFVIDCTDTEKRFRRGDYLTFYLNLFGTRLQTELWIDVLQNMALAGLTKRKHKFTLYSVSLQTRFPDSDTWQNLYVFPRNHSKGLQGTTEISMMENDDHAILYFLTPTQFNIETRFATDFTFSDLIKRLLRRYYELAALYEQPIGNYEFENFSMAAQKIVTQKELAWHRGWKRFSSTQGTVLNLDGHLGSIKLEGDLTLFKELLVKVQLFHVGKETVFGLGKMRLQNHD
jgi:hypothetical protein